MQITAIPAVPSATTAAAAKPDPSPIQAAVAALKAQKQEEAAKPFEPAPEIRPNIQDYVDINRTLLLLRKGGA